MQFNKLGLFDDKDLYPDIMSIAYKAYDITQEDFHLSYEKFDIALVETQRTIKVLNGSLYVDKVEFDITDKTLGDVYDILTKEGITFKTFKGFDDFYKLPAILLTNCSNGLITTVPGDVSPFNLDQRSINYTVNALEDRVVSVLVSDEDKITLGTITNNNVYYPPKLTTKLHIVSLSTKFYLQVDFSPKRSQHITATTLLNYGEH